MAALLGIGDGVLMTQLSALLALLFKHDTVLTYPVCTRQEYIWSKLFSSIKLNAVLYFKSLNHK